MCTTKHSGVAGDTGTPSELLSVSGSVRGGEAKRLDRQTLLYRQRAPVYGAVQCCAAVATLELCGLRLASSRE